MNPYYYYTNVRVPYLQPMIQANAWDPRNFNWAPQYGGWWSADLRNMPFTPAFSPTLVQTGLSFAMNQPPTCLFQQANAAVQPHVADNLATATANSSNTPPLGPSHSGNHPLSSDLRYRESMTDYEGSRKDVTDIGNLMDANLAGTRDSSACTLILTEGKAVMSLAMSGLSTIGRDIYGLISLKRRLINVRKLPIDKVKNNPDVKNITDALGLNYECTYESDEQMRTLRYGRVILMMDRDEDGSHMKGLIINLFHTFWPNLLRRNGFLMQFISPVVKVWCPCGCNNENLFKTIEDYEEWRLQATDIGKYAIKHYKSLESFTPQEMKTYFSNLLQNCLYFRYVDQEDDEALKLAFEKDRGDSRKDWMHRTMRESFAYSESLTEIRYKDFVDKELLFYSDLQNTRSFPSAIDGLTRSERKVLHAYFKRYYEQEVSVLRLIGSAFDVSAYKQSMDALSQTIINMAQDFVGTNNINILMPIGQFGTRMHGGKDAGKSKYLYTRLNPIMKYIFSKLDFPVLDYRKENDMLIEPSHYFPIIPMILVNGCEGIGTGWNTKIPKYDPKDIIKNLFRMLDGLAPTTMVPYFKDFRGQVEKIDDKQVNLYGILSVHDNKIDITELPIGVWTETYKEKVLNPMLKQNILSFEEYHTDTSVNFKVTVNRSKCDLNSDEKLNDMFHMKTNEKFKFVALDYRGIVHDYGDPIEILKQYFDVRLSAYESRKIYMQGKLDFYLRKLEDLHRNICYSDGNMIRSNLQGGKYDFIYDVKRIQEKDINTLEKDIMKTREELERLQQKSPQDLWREELEILCSKLEITLSNSHRVSGENSSDSEFLSLMNDLHL